MAQSDTVERILDAAERLFAKRGFADTSLRTITSEANVNLAAVNYHFGSKEALIQAIFARFLSPFSAELEKRLDALSEQAAADNRIEDSLFLLARIIDEIHDKDATRTITFMRLLGLAYTQEQGHLRKFIRDQYGPVFRRFLDRMELALPNLNKRDWYWGTQFALGTSMFAMSNLDALLLIHQRNFGEKPSVQEVTKYLIPYIAAGLRNLHPVPNPA